ncbi:hypothetical protein BCU94_02860 [Shewanella sp. 10N.286.52.C2]|uniref:hypothetical protein n=1 Tax=Shewanella sp. 10N.286.52.C2 TaxID=1880838 RepID=UPI000C861996|nr:hypothetical protein [Shewanella sp. 10N.286.52.C2]PMG29710.1 hypothetical protein BCU94_02860 [Shewanella sp. 10N.286.52.C2]
MKSNIALGLFFIALATFSVNSYSARDVDRTNNQAIAADQFLNELSECLESRDMWGKTTASIKGVLNLYEDQNKVRVTINKYQGRVRSYSQLVANRCVAVNQRAVSIHEYLANKTHKTAE